jgi:hypothetical protein
MPDVREEAAVNTMAKAVLILLLLLGAGAFVRSGSAAAADRAPARMATGKSHVLPFPRSPRAQAVWAERACWNACQAACTAALPKCFARESQGFCLEHNDTCDRACQSDCRTRGGPYVGALFAAPDLPGDDP